MNTFSKVDSESGSFTCYWRIENFFLRKLKNSAIIKSPIFKDNIFENEWFLHFQTYNQENLGLFLNNAQKTDINCFRSFSHLVNSGWTTELGRSSKSKFTKNVCTSGTERLICWKNIIEDEWKYLPNGSVTVSCRIWSDELKAKPAQCVMISRLRTCLEIIHKPIQYFTMLKPNDMLSFPISYKLPVEEKLRLCEKKAESTRTEDNNYDLERFMTLFKGKKFSFVTIRAHNKEFIVLKTVLCAKSPVFQAMCEKNMKENCCNIVNIDDIDSETLSSMLQYLHFKPIDLRWDSAVKLYYAAHKYQIDALKKECVSQLKKELSSENICEAFILADMHHDKDLKQKAVEFFCENSKTIVLSHEWKELMQNRTELASEILCEMVEKVKLSKKIKLL